MISGPSLMQVAARLLFPAFGLQKLDIHVGSVDADEFAAAVGKTRGGQEQKELFKIEALDRALNRQQSVGIRYGLKQAIVAPGTVDGHDAHIVDAGERDPIKALFFLAHGPKRLSQRKK